MYILNQDERHTWARERQRGISRGDPPEATSKHGATRAYIKSNDKEGMAAPAWAVQFLDRKVIFLPGEMVWKDPSEASLYPGPRPTRLYKRRWEVVGSTVAFRELKPEKSPPTVQHWACPMGHQTAPVD